MTSEYFYALSIVSAILGTYCSVRAAMDKGAIDLGNAAALLVVISVLSYAVAFTSAPRVAYYEETQK
jgi:hypothetical protein